MKRILISLALLTFVSCSNDSVKVINNSQRVSDLERRMALNEQLDLTQSDLLSLQAQAISNLEARVSANEDSIQETNGNLDQLRQDMIVAELALQGLIAQEAQAREDGDATQAAALAGAILSQQSVNVGLQSQINNLNAFAISQLLTNVVLQAQITSSSNKISTLTTKLANLTIRVSNAENDINSLEAQMLVVKQDILALGVRTSNVESGLAALASRVSTNESSISDLRTDVNYLLSNQVEIVDPCPSVANTEILLKVKGKLVAFYQGTEGFLSVLSDGSYRTTDPQQCTFTVSNNLVTSSAPATNPPVVTPPALAGSCLVKKIQDYGAEKHYQFTLSGSSGLVGDYKVVIGMSNNSSNLGTNNNGNFSFSSGNYSFTPINSATGFQIYSNGGNSSSIVQTAKVVKISTSQEIICTVNNSI